MEKKMAGLGYVLCKYLLPIVVDVWKQADVINYCLTN